jgi:hypothetical protein
MIVATLTSETAIWGLKSSSDTESLRIDEHGVADFRLNRGASHGIVDEYHFAMPFRTVLQ